MKNRVLLTIPFGMSARNILRTDIYHELKKCCRVIILSRLSRSQDFVNEFSAPDTVFYDLPPLQGWRTSLRSQLDALWTFEYGRRTGSENLRRRRERMKIEAKGQYKKLNWRAGLLSQLKLWRLISALTGNLIFQSTYCSDILDKENPDVVMTASPLVTEVDLLIMHLAEKRGIPTAGFVHSWDNIAKESNPWVLPDKLIVWNHIMKEQAISFLNLGEDDVFIAGVPQYDEYLFKTHILPKPEYLALKGIPDDSRIITYTCGSPAFFTDEEDFIRDMVELISKREFGNAILCLRLHPKFDSAERYERLFEHHPMVFFDKGDEAFDVSSLATWHRENSNNSYVNLICNSDVIINLASTVTIDAAIFDKPVVNVAYDLTPDKSFWFSNARYYESTHYQHITDSGGARIAYSREELIKYVKMYLNDPSIDKEGRQKIVTEQCYQTDGQACQRIADCLLAMAEKSQRKRGKI